MRFCDFFPTLVTSNNIRIQVSLFDMYPVSFWTFTYLSAFVTFKSWTFLLSLFHVFPTFYMHLFNVNIQLLIFTLSSRFYVKVFIWVSWSVILNFLLWLLDSMQRDSLSLLHYITMVKLILLFGVVGSFKKLPICCSEVGTRVFKIISKMLKDNMRF